MTIAIGLGIGSKNTANEWLETFFPAPQYQPDAKIVSRIQEALGLATGNSTLELNEQQLDKLSQLTDEASEIATLATQLKNSQSPAVCVIIETDETASSTP